jgi:hypothetical protein
MKAIVRRDAGIPKYLSPPGGKGLIRSLTRGFARTKKRHPVEAAVGRPAEPSICEPCGAVFSGRLWRRAQTAAEIGFGRIVIRGAFALANEGSIRRRVANVASRAARRQPERRISVIDRHDDMIEVITTSQKLAHRIVHELKKIFRGRASYAWSDDGTLFATWER